MEMSKPSYSYYQKLPKENCANSMEKVPSKLTVYNLGENFMPFREPEGSLPHSQEAASGSYHKSDKTSSHHHTVFL